MEHFLQLIGNLTLPATVFNVKEKSLGDIEALELLNRDDLD